MDFLRDLFKKKPLADNPSSSKPSESSEQITSPMNSAKCARCMKEFDWEQAYNQPDTPDSHMYNPPGHGNFRPRTFCPHCGFLVAEWDIDRYQDRDRWKWYGDNAEANTGRELPPNPLDLWGQAIPLDARAVVSEDHIDIELVMRLLTKHTASEVESTVNQLEVDISVSPVEYTEPPVAEPMGIPSSKEATRRAARVIAWVCTGQEDAKRIHQRLCKIRDVRVPGVIAELAQYTAAPPDRLADIRAAPPPGVVVIGEHKVGTGPWFSAAIIVPLSQLPAFHTWYKGAKYRYDLDDMWINSLVAEYPLDCDQKFSNFYLEHTSVIETTDLSEQSGVKEPLPSPQRHPAQCNLCKQAIKHGELVMRHSTDRTSMVCENCVKQGVATGKLPRSAVKLEPYDAGEEV